MKRKKEGKNFLTRFFEIVKQIHPNITDEEVTKISKQICTFYGGSGYRIPKMPGDKNRKAAKGLTIKEIQEKLNVSRSYSYKLYQEVNKTKK